MKKILFLVVILSLLLGLVGLVSGSSHITVYVENEKLHLEDPPIIKDGPGTTTSGRNFCTT